MTLVRRLPTQVNTPGPTSSGRDLRPCSSECRVLHVAQAPWSHDQLGKARALSMMAEKHPDTELMQQIHLSYRFIGWDSDGQNIIISEPNLDSKAPKRPPYQI